LRSRPRTNVQAPLKKHKASLLKTFWRRFWCVCSTIGRDTLPRSRHEQSIFSCSWTQTKSASELVCYTVVWFHLFLNVILTVILQQ